MFIIVKIQAHLFVVIVSCWGMGLALAQTKLNSSIVQQTDAASGPGKLETGFLKLQRSTFETHEARQQALREWHLALRAALQDGVAGHHERVRPPLTRLEDEARPAHLDTR